MGDHSAIEWTGATWNPVTGCTRVSPGCANCYIVRTPPFFYEGRTFERRGNEETTGLVFHPERLDPKKVKRLRPVDKPIFVCSLSDLFHEEIPADFICDVFATMRAVPERTFQVLTKRPERAIDVLSRSPLMEALPLPNVWIGVTIENARYTWRADLLREIPAAVRFISAEPLLGSLLPSEYRRPLDEAFALGAPDDVIAEGIAREQDEETRRKPLDLTGIDWLIVGGESGGRDVRPMHPDWARELRDACESFAETPYAICPSCKRRTGAGSFCECSMHDRIYALMQRPAFFFKQWGSWAPTGCAPAFDRPWLVSLPDGSRLTLPVTSEWKRWDERGGSIMVYAGASPKSGGRVLDGRTWDEMPGHAGQGVLFAGAEA